jgi:hypothetical protein
MDYRLEQFMKKYLPKDKETFSRDAVELLMSLLWDEAREAKKIEEEIERRRRDGREIIGPHDIP